LPKQDDVIEAGGVVVECLPNAMFRVLLKRGPFPEGHEILARAGGRLKKYSIRVIPGDEVDVEVTPYDLEKGRIVFRQSGTGGKRKNSQGGTQEPEKEQSDGSSTPNLI
jgi:translation initiation factor IF-1